MKIYYFDKDGKYSILESEDRQLEIPFIIRIYPGTSSVRFIITDEDKIDMLEAIKNSTRKADKFQYHFGKLVYNNGPTYIKDSWDIVDYPDYLGTWQNLADNVKGTSLEFFLRTRCSYGNYESMADKSCLSKPYYYNDIALNRMTDGKVYLFGKGIIMSENIRNSLIFVQGDYEVR